MGKSRDEQSIKKNEKGVVAIFVTMIMIVVITIIVLGFSQIAEREESDSLNRQLSTEAFYAAESGVNDAYSEIYNDVAVDHDPTLSPNLSNCLNGNPYVAVAGTSNVLSSGNSDQYTCLLINPSPTNLQDTPATGQPAIFDLTAPSANQFQSITINWQNSSGLNSYSASCSQLAASQFGKFPAAANWGSGIAICPPVIRVDLVPVPSGSFSEASLESSEKIFFLYPQLSASGTYSYTGDLTANGKILGAPCSGSCSVTINNLSASEYYLRLEYVYGTPPTYTVTAVDNNGAPVAFQGDEAQIDATGEAQNVLRRIQVTVCLNANASCTYAVPSPPNYAIQTNSSLCKSLDLDTGTNTTYEYIPAVAPADVLTSPGAGYHDINAVPGSAGTDPCDPYF